MDCNIKQTLSKLLTFVTAAQALQTTKTLRGVGSQNSDDFLGFQMSSFEGGATVMVMGDNFADSSVLNSIMMEPTWMEGTEILAPQLTTDDSFQSDASAGKITYRLPSAMELMKVDLGQFNGQLLPVGEDKPLEYYISVTNDKDGVQNTCSDPYRNCRVGYSLKATPILMDVIPSNVFYGQEVRFVFDAKSTHANFMIPDDAKPFKDIRIGGYLMDWTEIEDDFRLSWYHFDSFKAVVGDQPPGQTAPKVGFHTGYQSNTPASTHCNFAGDNCWTVQTHPVIHEISQSQGLMSGGQLLQIQGHGLNGTDVQVTVDGVPCQVLSSVSAQIECITGPKDQKSFKGFQPGSPGADFYSVKPENAWYIDQVTDPKYPHITDQFLTSLEVHSEMDGNEQGRMQGWFTAPTDGEYRFLVSCDDKCQLLLAHETPYVAGNSLGLELPEAPVIVNIESSCNWRDYFITGDPDKSQKSEWITLLEGKQYYMEGRQVEWGGDDHFTVSLEIKPSDQTSSLAGHKNASPMIQQFKVLPEQTFEEWSLTVQNPDGLYYKLNFAHRDGRVWTSDDIQSTCTANKMKNKIKGFFNNEHSSGITVTRVMYDAGQAETEEEDDAQTIVYSIKMMRLIDGYSTSSILARAIDTQAQISINKPQQGIKSAPPLSGNFVVKCTDPETQVEHTSGKIGFEQWHRHAEKSIDYEVPFLRNKVRFLQDYVKYKGNEISFKLMFMGLHKDIPLCSIHSAEGEDALTGLNINYEVTIVQNYASSLLFQPIHLDFLSQLTQSSQVLVSVNGLKAVCPDIGACDYLYGETLSQITTQQYDSELNQLTFAGTDLLRDLNSVTPEITLGPVKCSQDSQMISDLEGSCTLDSAPVAGEWDIKVSTSTGALKVNEQAYLIHIPLIVNSIMPASDINFNGGQNLVIAGNNFGNDPLTVQVLFEDGTICSVKAVQMQQITCTTNKFTTLASTQPQLKVTVTINSKAEDTSQFVTVTTEPASAVSISPKSVSPVLKTQIDIVLSAEFENLLSVDDLTATLTQESDPTFSKQLYVVSVDQLLTSVKIMFPGAWSGNYQIQIDSQIFGRIDNSVLNLQVGSRVTSVTPKSGSMYGGTLITITGENFSNEKLDNAVKIGQNYCNVITTSPSEITCKTDFLYTQLPVEEELIVFLKTSEECNSVEFTFIEPSNVVSDITQTFNEELEVHQVEMTGVFDDSLQLFIDGYEQSRTSIDQNNAVFNIVNLKKAETQDIEVMSSQGYAEGMQTGHSLSFVPALLSIYPKEGVMFGTLITVRGSGFGVEDDDTLKIQMAGYQCNEINIIEYGLFTCLTPAQMMWEGTQVSWDWKFQAAYGKQYYVSPNLEYSQTSSVKVSDATLSDSDHLITFTGSDFPTTEQSFSASVSIGGVDANEVTIIDSTTLSAVWSSTGIPLFTPSQVEIAFTYVDIATSQTYKIYPNIDDDLPSKTLLDVTSSSTGLQCSYAGGCAYQINAKGLTSSLLQENSQILMCGSTCELDVTLSTADLTMCTVPQLATLHSIEKYEIVQASELDGQLIYTEGFDGALLYDGDNTISPTYSSSQYYFGMQFKQDHVVILHQAKVFIYSIVDIVHYNNNFKLQGSNDGWATSVDLHIFNGDIHEGWNYVTFSENRPEYSSYRFFGNAVKQWQVTEFSFYGVETINTDSDSFECVPVIEVSGQKLDGFTLNSVTYSDSMTPVITDISPRFGSVRGGTIVTLTGDNLIGEASVLFDNRSCEITDQSANQIICTASDKPYVPGSSVTQIKIKDKGQVATQGLVFRYVSEWADPRTWGDFIPVEGDSVHIPSGQILLVNVEETPVLNTIIVEGGLIFAPDTQNPLTHRTFDAHIIMVRDGFMEVGTEKNPYTSKLTITMHSDRNGAYLPVYGNKVIGVRFGTLDMHGVERKITWTRLAKSVQPGDDQITLIDETDWQVGEEIVIAGTGWNNDCHETVFIAAGSGKEFTLDKALTCHHISEAPSYDGIEVPMQAEVGLLTRNVVFRGDSIVSPADLYGAHIMVHSPGDETSVGRISHVELKDVGQAFKLGRYPIHFHMIGTIHKSYVKGNSIHQTYNRAVTTHGVFYFRVIDNVAYDTLGHTFFVEDAIETSNLYEHNLSIKVQASNSLLNTDQTPGGFWITHPDNWVRGNAIAGSDAYGFWYDMQEHSIGPSFSENVCPEFAKLGEFKDNSAHSVRKYGLRIHHVHIPLTHPCQKTDYDFDYLEKGQTDPYWINPHVTATYENFTAYKCGNTCAITERTGAVIFKNFKVADFGDSGIEFSTMESVKLGYGYVKDALIVGKTGLNNHDTRKKTDFQMGYIHGIIGPRTEYFSVDGAKFYNFNNEVEEVAYLAGAKDSAALGTCSKCFHPATHDSGGRTMHTKNLHFGSGCTKMIKYQAPFREIIHDQDGTLTGLGADTFATFSYPHLMQPECTENLLEFDGLICEPSVQIRKIIFWKAQPDSFRGMALKVAKWDQSIQDQITSDPTVQTEFEQDVNNEHFSVIKFRERLNPGNSWSFATVTGHSYRLNWGEANDFESMTFGISDQWSPQDKNVFLMTNFTRVREAINVLDVNGQQIKNRTLIEKEEKDLVNGDNVVYNQTEVREFQWVVNGKDLQDRSMLTFNAYECLLNCEAEVVEDCTSMKEESMWSDPESWALKAAPGEGDEVVIGLCDNIVLDVDTPILKKLVVNGRLSFKNDVTQPQFLTLNAKLIHVNAGELLIGSSQNRYNGEAQIRLHGEPEDQTLQFSNIVEGGNKALVITGKAYFYGQTRDRISRLRATTLKGQNRAIVEGGLDWTTGDRVALLPTAMQTTHTDYAVIEGYDSVSGELIFKDDLQYYHWGMQESTETDYGMDMRGEVVLLSRNVKVVGEDNDTWGGQITVSDIVDEEDVERNGEIIFDSVEIFNCSQRNTQKAAIRFERAKKGQSLIKDSAVSGTRGWAFNSIQSENVEVQTTAFVGARAIGVGIQASNKLKFDQVIMADVIMRPGFNDAFLDQEACFSVCSLPDTGNCEQIKITNSIAAGCLYAGFIVPGHKCGEADSQDSFRNNIAHSVYGVGVIVYPDPASSDSTTCYEGSKIMVYKIDGAAINTMFTSRSARITNSIIVDNRAGLSNQVSGKFEKSTTLIQSTKIYGEIPGFADDCPENHNCFCEDKAGMQSSSVNEKEKPIHQTMTPFMPMEKIKNSAEFGAFVEIEDLTFSQFSSKTKCGSRQAAFTLNPDASDYVPRHEFKNTVIKNVEDDALAFLQDSPEKWNKLDECVGFPCTAPANVLLQFTNTRFEGEVRPTLTEDSFQIISDTDQVSSNLDSCTFKEAWNAWICQNDKLGVLIAIADDGDMMDRSVQPVYITCEETNYKNKLNSMMDHTWDGFYTSQKRKSMFPALIETDKFYTVEYTGTPFANMRYTLRASTGQVKLRVLYWNSGSYQVSVDGNIIDETKFDTTIGKASELSGTQGCGENRFVGGIDNYLEFIVTPDCVVTIKPIDSFSANVRMNWTLDQFYASGGQTSFADRVAGVLGIHASRIKVVNVYKGSVVVDFNVISEPAVEDEQTNDPDLTEEEQQIQDEAQATAQAATLEDLKKVKNDLTTLITSQDTSFGAPILSASTGAEPVIEDPTYTPPASLIPRLTEVPTLVTLEADSADGEEQSSSPQGQGVVIFGALALVLIVVGGGVALVLIIVLVLCICGWFNRFCCFKQCAKSVPSEKPESIKVPVTDRSPRTDQKAINHQDPTELWPAEKPLNVEKPVEVDMDSMSMQMESERTPVQIQIPNQSQLAGSMK